jgi:hypothetical protein
VVANCCQNRDSNQTQEGPQQHRFVVGQTLPLVSIYCHGIVGRGEQTNRRNASKLEGGDRLASQPVSQKPTVDLVKTALSSKPSATWDRNNIKIS